MELLASEKRELGFNEILRKIDIPKPSLSRILTTLVTKGYLRQNPLNRKYWLGSKLLVIGSVILDRLDLREIARPYLQRLVEETGETAELGILDEGHLLYIDKRESSESIRLFARVGSRYANFHASAPGKVLLAYFSDEELEDFLKSNGLPKITEKTITTPSQLKKELVEIRKNGAAFDDQEVRLGVRRIAVPIFDHRKKLAGVIGIAGPTFRITLREKAQFVKPVVNAGKAISKELGYRDN